MLLESETVEFKRIYTEDVKKTVIAFANTTGGEVRIGIADDGAVVGVDDPDKIMLQIANATRDSVRPDVTMHLRIDTETLDGKCVVVVLVQQGTARPYYLTDKGLRPEGVYLRYGASTVPASASAILNMIRDTGGDSFEETRSLLQELTFTQTGIYFEQEKLQFKSEQQRSLGIIGQDGTYSNLGLLLSDQCTHTIKAAVFEGSAKRVFQDRAEFSGSLLKQLDDALRYLNTFNHTRSEISGLRRIDTRSYPPEALREAFLNTVVHREYSFGGSSLVSVFDDRIEFVSLGGLPKGIAFGDLKLGVSMPRNPKLANVFYRLQLIEAYGTGIPKIMECYSDCDVQPVIETSENAFKMTLPNRNFNRSAELRERNAATASAVKEHQTVRYIADAEQQVMHYLKDHPGAARRDVEAALGFSQAKTVRLLTALVEKGVLRKNGLGRNTRYASAGEKLS